MNVVFVVNICVLHTDFSMPHILQILNELMYNEEHTFKKLNTL